MSIVSPLPDSSYAALFQQAAVGLALVDDAGRLLAVNPALCEFLGYEAAELVGRPSAELSPPEDGVVTRDQVRALQRGDVTRAMLEKRYLRKDGELRWGALTLSRARFADGATGLLGVVQDVTARRRLEEQLAHYASHDPLTGLANRRLFVERVGQAMERVQRGEHAAVLFVDVDDFKAVNDACGHQVGDELLVVLARRLLRATRGGDTVARLGGDEFAVLLDGLAHRNDVDYVTPRILDSIAQPVSIAGRTLRVSGSVGVAIAQVGDGADDVMRNADVAMYRAKVGGKNRAATFSLASDGKALARLALQTELAHALERGQIALVYQPIVDLASGRVVGAEALARWRHPERGPVPPDVFIPLAEATGCMPAIGRWVLRTACAFAARWPAVEGSATGGLTLTVNVSGRQLEHVGFLEDLASALRDSALPPSRLVLEVTESVLLTNAAVARTRLEAVRALGVRVAVDDFGTGYSSLTSLQHLPLDTLKIDKAFTQGVAHDARQRALTDTVIRLGRALGLRTVAEGIETTDERDALLALGCQLGQGYLYARPLSPAEFGACLVERGIADAGVVAPSPALVSGRAPDAPRRTLLVVDDEAEVRELLARVLAADGYEVLAASDGAAALRLLATQAPRIALVLSDVVMPELSGWSLAEALRTSHPGLPVIFMSGYAEDEMWERRVAAPQAPVLRKPLALTTLLDAVRDALAA